MCVCVCVCVCVCCVCAAARGGGVCVHLFASTLAVLEAGLVFSGHLLIRLLDPLRHTGPHTPRFKVPLLCLRHDRHRAEGPPCLYIQIHTHTNPHTHKHTHTYTHTHIIYSQGAEGAPCLQRTGSLRSHTQVASDLIH